MVVVVLMQAVLVVAKLQVLVLPLSLAQALVLRLLER